MELTQAQLLAIFPNTPRTSLSANLAALNKVLRDYQINTPVRVAEFMGQLGVESGELRYTAEIWGPTTAQKRYERDFSQPWTKTNPRNKKAFELGNSQKGDGYRMRGGGWIQTTGRANYEKLSEETGIDFVSNPELLRKLPYAADSAGRFWERHNLNALADTSNVRAITKTVNGWYTHLVERTVYRDRALEVFEKFGYPIEKKKDYTPIVLTLVALALVGVIYWKRNELTKWIQRNIPGLPSRLAY